MNEYNTYVMIVMYIIGKSLKAHVLLVAVVIVIVY